MNTGVRHAFTGALYECDDEGRIIVTDGNRRGVFDRFGRWISGDLREADPQLCGGVAGEHYGSTRVVPEETAAQPLWQSSIDARPGRS